jgi:hypothetical protein
VSPSSLRGTIIVAGSLAQKVPHGGHPWVLLHYLLGFQRLGWEVLFLDQLPAGVRASPAHCAAFRRVMDGFGLQGRWAIRDDASGAVAGLSRAEVLERVRRSALLLNVMGFLTWDEVLAVAPRRVFLDIDPGFPQMWRALGLADPFAGHDDFVTIGERIGEPGCTVPTCGLRWLTSPPPVVLKQWPVATAPAERVTSVATWRGSYGPVDYLGQRFGLRVHEFRAFTALPARSPLPLELALAIDPADRDDLRRLQSSGWRLVDPDDVAADPWSYREYIRRSAGEFMVAKNMYVRACSGWFSDRSVCYLASGRPVLAQDTGFVSRYPTGLGLVAFTTLPEAEEALKEIAAQPAKHRRAARELAEEFFDSDRVLGRLLSKLGVA